VGINRVPYDYDWMQGGKPIYLPHFEFRKRTGTKREERGAGAVKRVMVGAGRNLQRKTAKESYTGKTDVASHKKGNSDQRLRPIKTNRDLEDSKWDGKNEAYRSDELAANPKDDLNEDAGEWVDVGMEGGEWVDVEVEDEFDLVESDAEGVVLETEDDWPLLDFRASGCNIGHIVIEASKSVAILQCYVACIYSAPGPVPSTVADLSGSPKLNLQVLPR
jgi:hypothetical protein